MQILNPQLGRILHKCHCLILVSTIVNKYFDIINQDYILNGLSFNAIYLKWNNNATNKNNGNIVVKYMIHIRDGFKHCDVLEADQIKQIIDHICVQQYIVLFASLSSLQLF